MPASPIDGLEFGVGPFTSQPSERLVLQLAARLEKVFNPAQYLGTVHWAGFSSRNDLLGTSKKGQALTISFAALDFPRTFSSESAHSQEDCRPDDGSRVDT
jgi:hypothetical protein